MTFRAAPLTLDALQGLTNAIAAAGGHLDSCVLLRTPTPMSDADVGVEGGPCPLGLAERFWLRLPRRADGTCLHGMTFRLNAGWCLGAALVGDTPPAFTGPLQAPRTGWSEGTLSAIHDLIARSEGFYSFRIFDKATHKPKGSVQDSENGWTAREWVDQSCGYSGDDFTGTVSWILGRHVLVGTFAC